MTAGDKGRIAVLLAAGGAAAAAVLLHAPVPQDQGYHAFADARGYLGVPNFWNVVSNLPFLLVGVLGLKELPRGSAPAAYRAFFAGVVLTAFGSAYYHWAPSDATLTWDRLPMTTAFMAFVAAMIGDYSGERRGERALAPLIIAGAASVAYWRATGDLRAYVLVQFLPMLLMPLLLLLFPPTFTRASLLWATLACYALAKALEQGDARVYAWGGVMSGHALKHAVAALGMYAFLLAARARSQTAR